MQCEAGVFGQPVVDGRSLGCTSSSAGTALSIATRNPTLDRFPMADVVRRLEDRGLVVRHPAMKHGELQLREVNRRARQLDVKLMRGYRAGEYKRLLEELNQLAERWEGLVEDEPGVRVRVTRRGAGHRQVFGALSSCFLVVTPVGAPCFSR